MGSGGRKNSSHLDQSQEVRERYNSTSYTVSLYFQVHSLGPGSKGHSEHRGIKLRSISKVNPTTPQKHNTTSKSRSGDAGVQLKWSGTKPLGPRVVSAELLPRAELSLSPNSQCFCRFIVTTLLEFHPELYDLPQY